MKNMLVVNGATHSGMCAAICRKLDVPVVHLIDGIENAVERVLAADIVVFVTPVRWFNMSAPMKQLIDALPESPDFPCEGKIALFIAVCNEDGGQQAINQMFAPLNHMGFRIPPFASLTYNTTMAEQSEDRWQVKDLAGLADRLRTL